ncbi:MAG: AIR synthase-related protein, partial [Candidatus Omnitrophica bacterium]|nr:AIR synthase-related protein [Candidatus Omnitrophota bacterium]
VARILPGNTDAVIYKASWKVPSLFWFIQSKGRVREAQMYHTLNMGVGMALVVERAAVKAIMARLGAQKLRSWVIGEIVKGHKRVEII